MNEDRPKPTVLSLPSPLRSGDVARARRTGRDWAYCERDTAAKTLARAADPGVPPRAPWLVAVIAAVFATGGVALLAAPLFQEVGGAVRVGATLLVIAGGCALTVPGVVAAGNRDGGWVSALLAFLAGLSVACGGGAFSVAGLLPPLLGGVGAVSLAAGALVAFGAAVSWGFAARRWRGRVWHLEQARASLTAAEERVARYTTAQLGEDG